MIYLNNWFQNNLRGKNGILFALILCIITLPLSKLGLNNIAFILLALTTLINYKQLKFNNNKALYIPIAYYILLGLSCIWSIDIKQSVSALSKEITLLLFPLIFLFLPKFKPSERNKVLRIYSYSMTLYSLFLLLKAFIRYLQTKDINVFFYHELVTLEINAIYISVIFSLALLYILRNNLIKWWDYLAALLLFTVIILLSSKNIIVITIFLAALSFVAFKRKIELKNTVIIIGCITLITVSFGNKIAERFKDELKDIKENVVLENGVVNVSLKNAIYQEKFDKNHYFSGSSFRVYQLRLLYELILQDHIFWTGYGANASQDKVREVQIKRNYQEYFGELNFHNQYAQSFAELGFIGFLIFAILIGFSIYKAIKTKDYNFLVFILLTSSLCITESLFSRQRGVVFFITFYCLYHHSMYIEKKDENV